MPVKKNRTSSQIKFLNKSSKKNKSVNKSNIDNFQKKIKIISPLSLNNNDETYSSLRSGIIFNIVSGIIAIIININALVWLNKLETIKCECSGHWMREYIKYYLYFAIPIFIINLIIYMYAFITDDYNLLLSNENSIISFYNGFTSVVSLFGIINIFIAIIFINKLKELNCECSEDIKREIYWIYNIILASIILLVIIFMLISIPLVVLNMRN
jgi:hypothetical protein